MKTLIDTVVKYLPAILIVLLLGFYLITKNQQEKTFKNEIRKLDSAREALQMRVDSLNSKTRERDSVLSSVLKRNLEIIDTLNSIQRILSKEKKEIDKKIEESKEVIDQYWKNNN